MTDLRTPNLQWPDWAHTLQQALDDRSHAWRTPMLATADEGGAPDLRSVVLRNMFTGPSSSITLEIHSHVATRKVSHIRTQPAVAVCFWDQTTQQQLRIQGAARVVTDEETRRTVWQAVPVASQGLYAISGMPGVPIGADDDPQDLVTDYAAFCVIRIIVTNADFLDLSTRPHTRQQWMFSGQTGWTATSVHP